ncbi:MAG: DUF5063 domain-containing protein [Mangrovibacterium sp.]
MSEELNKIIYSKQTIEFVAVSNEFCLFVEEAGTMSAQRMLSVAQKLLTLLYLKTSMLPDDIETEEAFLESFVSEVDYAYLQSRIRNILGEHDDYKEVFTVDIQYAEEALSESISESILDIYQDLKDFVMNYRTSDEDVMLDALSECLNHFKDFWGQRLVNVLRPIHQLVYGDVDFEQKVQIKSGQGEDENIVPTWLAGKYDLDEE